MAAGVVSGAVALVLEANAKLTPAQVKMALQYSATYMPGPGLVGAGAGALNAAAAIDSALNGPSRQSASIAGEAVEPSGLVMLDTLALRTSKTRHFG